VALRLVVTMIAVLGRPAIVAGFHLGDRLKR
jgi:hypothetical protein